MGEDGEELAEARGEEGGPCEGVEGRQEFVVVFLVLGVELGAERGGLEGEGGALEVS